MLHAVPTPLLHTFEVNRVAADVAGGTGYSIKVLWASTVAFWRVATDAV
eukprot:SAG31_NODE_34189_length_335_cov_1.300847_1_plen_48_part_01